MHFYRKLSIYVYACVYFSFFSWLLRLYLFIYLIFCAVFHSPSFAFITFVYFNDFFFLFNMILFKYFVCISSFCSASHLYLANQVALQHACSFFTSALKCRTALGCGNGRDFFFYMEVNIFLCD